MNLAQSLEWIRDDEFLEVTPKSLRLRNGALGGRPQRSINAASLLSGKTSRWTEHNTAATSAMLTTHPQPRRAYRPRRTSPSSPCSARSSRPVERGPRPQSLLFFF